MDVYAAIEIVNDMIATTGRVTNKIAEIPGSESLNGGTSIGIRLQVLSDVKRELTTAAIRELENEGARE